MTRFEPQNPPARRESTHRRVAMGGKNGEILSQWRRYVCWGRGTPAKAKAQESRAARRALRQELGKFK